MTIRRPILHAESHPSQRCITLAFKMVVIFLKMGVMVGVHRKKNILRTWLRDVNLQSDNIQTLWCSMSLVYTRTDSSAEDFFILSRHDLD